MKRHPAEVTADRLGEAYEKWYDKFDGAELDMISQLKHAFDEIAEQPEYFTHLARVLGYELPAGVLE